MQFEPPVSSHKKTKLYVLEKEAILIFFLIVALNIFNITAHKVVLI